MNLISIFKKIAFVEGTSLILLLFFAMPMKYFFDTPIFVRIIGMTHGILFLAYIYLTFIVKNKFNWTRNDLFAVCLASVIPFGTFYADKKYFKKF